MKKAISLVLTLAMTLTLLSGCWGSSGDTTASSANSTTGTASSTATSTEEEPDGIIAGTHIGFYYTNDLSTLLLPGTFAYGGALYGMLYDTLFYSPDGTYDTVEGLIAKDWTISDDNLVWTINLHDDIYFTNGRNLTAESVVGSFDLLQSDGGQSASFSAIESYVATDTHELTITFKYISTEFMWQFSVPTMGIFDPTDALENGVSTETMQMSGSGPYYLSEYALADHMTFTAKEDHWNPVRQAHVETMTCWILSDYTTQQYALTTGEVHVGGIADYNTYEALLATADNLVYYDKPYEVRTIWINTSGLFCEYLTNERVREAICMMIDMEEVAIAETGDWGYAVNKVFAESIEYEQNRTYDPEGGLAILEEEGIDPSDIVLQPVVSVKSTATFTNIQAQLSKYGITVDFSTLDTPAAATLATAGEWDMLVENGGITPQIFVTGVPLLLGEGGQYNVVSDSILDPILEDMCVEAFSQDTRDAELEVLAEMAQVLDENYLYVGSIAIPSWFCADESVHGMTVDANGGFWRPWEIWVDG